jgi:hypothetical protein
MVKLECVREAEDRFCRTDEVGGSDGGPTSRVGPRPLSGGLLWLECMCTDLHGR